MESVRTGFRPYSHLPLTPGNAARSRSLDSEPGGEVSIHAVLRVRMGSDAFVATASTVVDDTQLAEIQAVPDSLGTDDSCESKSNRPYRKSPATLPRGFGFGTGYGLAYACANSRARSTKSRTAGISACGLSWWEMSRRRSALRLESMPSAIGLLPCLG